MSRDSRLGMVHFARFSLTYNNLLSVKFNSPIYELLNTCVKFGLLDKVIDMTNGQAPVMTKKKWSETGWNKAWFLDDAFRKSTAIMHARDDLLAETAGKSQYLTWWHIQGNLPQTQGMCETMSRLICHTSRLKDNDFRLARGSHSENVCTACDLNIKELIKQLVMQCPESEELKADMFKVLVTSKKDTFFFSKV